MDDEIILRAKPDEVAAKVIDGEAVLINLATGVYYSMRGSGAFLWSRLEPGSNIALLSAALAARYGLESVQARRDVEPCLDRGCHPTNDADTNGGPLDHPRLVRPRVVDEGPVIGGE